MKRAKTSNFGSLLTICPCLLKPQLHFGGSGGLLCRTSGMGRQEKAMCCQREEVTRAACSQLEARLIGREKPAAPDHPPRVPLVASRILIVSASLLKESSKDLKGLLSVAGCWLEGRRLGWEPWNLATWNRLHAHSTSSWVPSSHRRWCPQGECCWPPGMQNVGLHLAMLTSAPVQRCLPSTQWLPTRNNTTLIRTVFEVKSPELSLSP